MLLDMTITGPVIRVSGEDVLHKALWVFIFWGCAPWTSSQSRGYWCERMSSWLIYKMRMSEICFTLQAKDFTAWWPNEAGLAQPTRLKEVSKSEGFPISYKAASPAGVEVCEKTHVTQSLFQRFRILFAGTGLVNSCETQLHWWVWGL